MNRNLLTLFLALVTTGLILGQTGSIQGQVHSADGKLEFATIHLENTSLGAQSNYRGNYKIENIPFGNYTLVASYVGFKPVKKVISIDASNTRITADFELNERSLELEAVVITATKTHKRQTQSPIIVNILNSKTLNDVQACNLSEGLKFQPGLRVETDCQTCNYTQLRMNGLAGGYSQILINGRPIFSPLTGLYGMEQLPVNLIDRIEVVRGGASSLYGSSAIGGTVNVITKIPIKNSYDLNYNYQNINGQSSDHQFFGNATAVSKKQNSGVSFFLTKRNRDFYDHNADNFSELPLIQNTSAGVQLFFLPSENQKLELSINHLNEYRFGGEMIDQPAHFAAQSEERNTSVWMANLDYQYNFNKDNSSLISYLAWQKTNRSHYTGILPDSVEELNLHLEDPPYGTSDVYTYNIGLQLNHRIKKFIAGSNVLTFGTEFIVDDVYDAIEPYNYLIDQRTENLGLFVQSDWELTSNFTLLSGLRMDQHSLVTNLVFNPRVSLLYKLKKFTQFRLNYGTGFRAPQAFDADMHIAFAGGGISRVQLSPDLYPETSQSFSASVNYDKPKDKYIFGFTLEGFHTALKNAFYLQPIGEDDFGEVFEKQNGSSAMVQGLTLELRANYNRKMQLEGGFTLQQSRFMQKVAYIEGIEGIRDFIRTPNDYGYATLSFMPNKILNASLNYVYTGSMYVAHFAGAENQKIDEIITSQSFHDLGSKLSYTWNLEKLKTHLELYGGIKNIFNSYQKDFDIGKNRDSNFIYGPAQARTFYIGLRFKS